MVALDVTWPTTPLREHDPLAAHAEMLSRFLGRVPFVRVVDDVLDAPACAAVVRFIDAAEPAPATVNGVDGVRLMPQVRNNDRVIFDDVTLAHAWLERARPVLPERIGMRVLCGFNERFRAYRYQPGQFFAPHLDGHFERDHVPERSDFTALLYLNDVDDSAGGETHFLDFDITVKPARGRMLLFEHRMLHEGRAVVHGSKYVLRSDVMYRG